VRTIEQYKVAFPKEFRTTDILIRAGRSHEELNLFKSVFGGSLPYALINSLAAVLQTAENFLESDCRVSVRFCSYVFDRSRPSQTREVDISRILIKKPGTRSCENFSCYVFPFKNTLQSNCHMKCTERFLWLAKNQDSFWSIIRSKLNHNKRDRLKRFWKPMLFKNGFWCKCWSDNELSVQQRRLATSVWCGAVNIIKSDTNCSSDDKADIV